LYDYNTTYTFYDTAGTDLAGNPIAGLPVSFSFTTLPSGVEGRPDQAAQTFYLAPVAPNPVTARAEFRYGLAQATTVRLEIYNVTGQRVRTLINTSQPAGQYSVKWNACDENGRKVSSGAYVYRLQAGDRSCAKRFTMIK
jgi:hypothetical protein